MVNDLLEKELNIKSISEINIHMKVEALLKDNPARTIHAQQARTILWQRYAVAAIFSPVF